MIKNQFSKIDTLSGRAPPTMVLETNETNTENLASTSRSTELNGMTQAGGPSNSIRSKQEGKAKKREAV